MENESSIRINKYLSHAGVCSRREADRMIAEERVSINGVVATTGSKVGEGDLVCVDGRKISKTKDITVLAYYKPRGIVCSNNGQGAKTVREALQYKKAVSYVGRLDKDSEGLLLLTDDGDLSDAICRSRNGHEKEYLVWVHKPITDAFLKCLREGIQLEDAKTKPCIAERHGDCVLRMVLTQGLNRQIRRMCETCGYHVKRLKRIRVLNITLDGLVTGEYRKLTEEEIRALKICAGVAHNEELSKG